LIVLAWVVVAALLFAPILGVQYVAQLPYAPQCPRCRSVTGQVGAPGAFDRVLGLLAGVLARSCTQCGWVGRMRWRLSPNRLHSRPSE
jgi:hypothetical protein